MAYLLEDQTFKALKDLRDVLDHRGAVPRGYAKNLSEPDRISGPFISPVPKEATRTLPYGRELSEYLVRVQSWVEENVERMISELEALAGKYLEEGTPRGQPS
jgi:hypothetical protein